MILGKNNAYACHCFVSPICHNDIVDVCTSYMQGLAYVQQFIENETPPIPSWPWMPNSIYCLNCPYSLWVVSNFSVMSQVETVDNVEISAYRNYRVGVSVNPIGGTLSDPELKLKMSFSVATLRFSSYIKVHDMIIMANDNSYKIMTIYVVI